MENDEITVKIYCIVDPFSLKVRYIGRTKLTLETRLQYHLGKAKSLRKYGKRTSHTHNWLNQCVDNGKRPIIRQLCEVIGWSYSHKVEKGLIAKYEHRLTNHDDKGEGQGIKIISDEQKKQISETLRRKYASGEIISLSKKEIHVYDLLGNYLKSFDSLKECGDELDLDEAKLIGIRKGVYKQWKGYQFSEIKVEKMTDISNRQKDNWTKIEILNTETNEKLFFKSIAECNRQLDITDSAISLYTLPYLLKHKHGNRFVLVEGATIKKVNIRDTKTFVRDLKTNEILEFNTLRELGDFLNIPKFKRFTNYMTKSMKRKGLYEFVNQKT